MCVEYVVFTFFKEVVVILCSHNVITIKSSLSA